MTMEKNIIDQVFPETLKILADLIKFQTVSGTSNLKLIEYCEKKLNESGATSFKTFHKSGLQANLFSTINGKEKLNSEGIILSGHTDVVPASSNEWSSDPYIAQEKDNKVYGRGSCDMKGFIACTLVMAPLFAKQKLKKPIHFSYTYDEETSCLGAPVLLKELKKRNVNYSVCIIGEPTDMKAIHAHKGYNEYKTYFTGLAGHASDPVHGVNAIEYAIRYANKLMELREELKKRKSKDSVFTPPYSTLQIGKISGGLSTNVIADQCIVDWEVRPITPEDGKFISQNIESYAKETLLPEMRKVYPKANIKKETVGETIGFNKVEKSDAVDLVCNLTGDNSRGAISFGTEAGLFQELGISTVVCGPGSIKQAHTIDEYVTFDQLKLCLKMLVNLRDRLI
ncbi:MAG: acetylornithine deacetylase [Pelagibacteraceae bacterium]|jgi:acetylornithine deacetylase|nr:acetylornithine deacetylase [Pelagibacteraceae bacterium]MBO6481398.1 acetylornithine deacetylase [Pelagibacteraceae bacterium]MBO6484657.1 acetylornithine deacetylase [Pelagibacteraceae bacterium]MBO6486378.1 acetylornithine deacetylase [Pelagibacteraceae bacterium]MBO6487438.1 acetylornithine deacetylase [Pelagibacteraceae bacterium]